MPPTAINCAVNRSAVDGSRRATTRGRSVLNRSSLREPIVTQVTPASAFYRAEEYHQRYFDKQGRAACAVTLCRCSSKATTRPRCAAGGALDRRARWRRHRAEERLPDRGPRKDTGERVTVEAHRATGDRDRAGVMDAVDTECRKADEILSKEWYPPRERVATHLLDCRIVELDHTLGLPHGAHMRPSARHRIAVEAASVYSQTAGARGPLGCERHSVPPDERKRRAHARGSSQSLRMARVIARMSRRSSSAVARPQYQ